MDFQGQREARIALRKSEARKQVGAVAEILRRTSKVEMRDREPGEVPVILAVDGVTVEFSVGPQRSAGGTYDNWDVLRAVFGEWPNRRNIVFSTPEKFASWVTDYVDQAKRRDERREEDRKKTLAKQRQREANAKLAARLRARCEKEASEEVMALVGVEGSESGEGVTITLSNLDEEKAEQVLKALRNPVLW